MWGSSTTRRNNNNNIRSRSTRTSFSSPADSTTTNTGGGAPLVGGNDYYYVEDYGNSDNKSRGSSVRGLVSGPFMFLWTCRKTFLNPPMISAIAMISSLISMQIVVDSLLVTTASMLTICISLLVLLQQRKLRKLATLRKEHNNIRRQANYLNGERERLHRLVDRLDTNVAELHYIPQELHKITNSSRVDIDDLVHLVHEQSLVQEKLRNKIQQRVMQQLLSVVVKADKDQDFALSSKEIDVLTMRLRAVKGIEFNERRFKEMLNDDPSIHSVFKMLRSMKERDEEYQYGDPIFIIKLENFAYDQNSDKDSNPQMKQEDDDNNLRTGKSGVSV
jgi:hypothetical protein